MFGIGAGLHARTAALWLAVIGVVASAVGAPASLANSRWGPEWFPNHEVTAHTGETFRFYDDLIEGKMVVVNFIYTRCDDVCPLQTARLMQIVERVGDRIGEDIFVYSITLEPEVDTPPVLASLADAFGIEDGWLFLSGDPKELAEIRYRLGDRTRDLSEHRNDLMLGNDVERFWSRSSLFGDVDVVAREILSLDPEWRAIPKAAPSNYQPTFRGDIAKDVGRGLFVKGCASCHNVAGPDSIGPDLYGVTEARDPAWLRAFVRQPDRMRREGDPLALELSDAWPGVKMPSLGLSETDVNDVITFLANEQKRIDAGGAPLVRGWIQQTEEAASAR